MLVKKRFVKSLTSILMTSLLIGCGKSVVLTPPIIPQAQVVPSQTYMNSTYNSWETEPVLPSGTTAISMTMSGEDNMKISLGTIKQFTVDVKLNNGQILKNFTKVKWSVANPDIGSINNNGIFTPARQGSTKIIANISGVAAVKNITVVGGTTSWVQVSSPTKVDLNAVKLVSDVEAWAVGAGGTILHYYNGLWNNIYEFEPSPANGVILNGIDCSSSGEGWIVGDNGTILRLESGGKWTKFPSPTTANLKSIDMISPTSGWIVGEEGGKGVILQFNGINWQEVKSLNSPLNSVSALTPSDVWVCGQSGNLSSPAIYHFNGDKWEKAKYTTSLFKIKLWTGKYNLKAIKMMNSSQGWAVGEYQPLLNIKGKKGIIFYYDSIKDIWSEGSIDTSKDSRFEYITFNNIGMISATQGWVLGNTVTTNFDFSANKEIPGNLLKCDGKNLSIETNIQTNSIGGGFYGIDVLSNGNGIIVGANGLILQKLYDFNKPYNESNYGNFSGNISYYSNYYNGYSNYNGGYTNTGYNGY